ncbi:MAG: PilT protein N-terminal [Planctomycetaceae bacterium]|nr:PilT protein N-terminal [Planctomycetaceae bacterium]
MSVFVLDSSVAVKWVLSEAGTPKALAFLDEVRKDAHQIIAPDVFATEIAHVLTKAERKKLIPVGDAVKHIFDILADGPDLRPFMPLLPRAIDIRRPESL